MTLQDIQIVRILSKILVFTSHILGFEVNSNYSSHQFLSTIEHYQSG